MSELYRPSEDTFLLADAVKGLKGGVALEIGVGSGLVSAELSKSFEIVVGTELNHTAVREALRLFDEKRCRDRVELVCCDGGSVFRDAVFDLVAFNPPYLPSSKRSDPSTDGGLEGIEVAERWFQEAARIAKRCGQIYFVSSSLSNRDKLFSKITSLGYVVKPLEKRKLFFEEIFVAVAVRS